MTNGRTSTPLTVRDGSEGSLTLSPEIISLVLLLLSKMKLGAGDGNEISKRISLVFGVNSCDPPQRTTRPKMTQHPKSTPLTL
jgi:hypothetical protein